MKRILLKFRRVFNPESFRKITGSERYVIMTALALMNKPDSKLLLHPSKERIYIQSADEEVTIILDMYPAEATVVNHKYRYDVKMSNRAASVLHSRFTEYTEGRRDKLEEKCFMNTEYSLRIIYEETVGLRK